ncbi:MAG: baseplate J/gp47 family protein [Ktedonobacteraceae bacterium]
MNEPLETIHVYIVKEDEEQPLVESTVNDASSTPIETDTQPLVTVPYPTHLRLVPYLIMATHLLIVLFALFSQIYITLTETATITIRPKQAVVTTHLTFSHVQSRIFSPITLTQTKTVPVTGKGHQDATAATGTITLYNAATQEQTIDAGTLFIGTDGVHIITDQAAVIPGATPPVEGQTIVAAHAVNVGTAGNIQAGDIQGACCKENIFAYNSAFSGGQDERNYTMVAPRDIDEVVSSVLPALTQTITRSLKNRVRPEETLTTAQCSQTILANHQAGDEAISVTVLVQESCVAGAYNTNDLHTKVKQALSQEALRTLGHGYLLSTYFTPSPMQTSIKQGDVVIVGTFAGRMVYQFSQQDLSTLRHLIAGKTRQQAVQTLSHLKGAEAVTLRLSEGDSHVPLDTEHIHVAILV